MTDVDARPQATADQGIDHLERLAAELPSDDYHTQLVATGRRAHLHVRNRHAGILAEDVLVEAGWFWYSFAERISPVADISTAAKKVARLLRVVDTR